MAEVYMIGEKKEVFNVWMSSGWIRTFLLRSFYFNPNPDVLRTQPRHFLLNYNETSVGSHIWTSIYLSKVNSRGFGTNNRDLVMHHCWVQSASTIIREMLGEVVYFWVCFPSLLFSLFQASSLLSNVRKNSSPLTKRSSGEGLPFRLELVCSSSWLQYFIPRIQHHKNFPGIIGSTSFQVLLFCLRPISQHIPNKVAGTRDSVRVME